MKEIALRQYKDAVDNNRMITSEEYRTAVAREGESLKSLEDAGHLMAVPNDAELQLVMDYLKLVEPSQDGQENPYYPLGFYRTTDKTDPIHVYMDKSKDTGDLLIAATDGENVTRIEKIETLQDAHDKFFEIMAGVIDKESQHEKEKLALRQHTPEDVLSMMEDTYVPPNSKIVVFVEKYDKDGDPHIVANAYSDRKLKSYGDNLAESVYYDAIRTFATNDISSMYNDVAQSLLDEVNDAKRVSEYYFSNVPHDIRITACRLENGKPEEVFVKIIDTHQVENDINVQKEHQFNPFIGINAKGVGIEKITSENRLGEYSGFRVVVGDSAYFDAYTQGPEGNHDVFDDMPLTQLIWQDSKDPTHPDNLYGKTAELLETIALYHLHTSPDVPESVRQWSSKMSEISYNINDFFEKTNYSGTIRIPDENNNLFMTVQALPCDNMMAVSENNRYFVCTNVKTGERVESDNIYEVAKAVIGRESLTKEFTRKENVLQNYFNKEIIPMRENVKKYHTTEEGPALLESDTRKLNLFCQKYAELYQLSEVPTNIHDTKCYKVYKQQMRTAQQEPAK